MPSHTYYLRSVKKNGKKRAPPLDIGSNMTLENLEELLWSTPSPQHISTNSTNSTNSANNGIDNTKVAPSPPLSWSTATITPPPVSTTPSAKSCNLDLSQSTLLHFGFFKGSIINDIERLVNNIENPKDDPSNLTKMEYIATLKRYLKEFHISCEYDEVYAESKLLLFKIRV